MRKLGLALSLMAVAGFVLSGCGGSDDSADESAAPAAQQSKATQTAQKTGAAKDDNLPKLKCPAKVNKNLAGPDIIGLKLGMTQAEALNVVRCHTKDAGHLSFQQRWFEQLRSHALKLENQAFSVQHGETSECNFRNFSDMQKCGVGNRVWDHVAEKITVATPGLPGRETVVAVWRVQTFKDGEMPARESLITALTQKYGAIQFQQGKGDRFHNIYWGEDAGGNRLAEGHPLYGTCVTGGIQPRGGAVWREGCGISISAQIIQNPSNPNLVQELHIGMLHQNDLWNYSESLQMELDQIEQKRQQEELERARKSGSDVQL